MVPLQHVLAGEHERRRLALLSGPLLPAALEEPDAARHGAPGLAWVRGRLCRLHEGGGGREGDRGARGVGGKRLPSELLSLSGVSPGGRLPHGPQDLLGPGLVDVRIVPQKVVRRRPERRGERT